MFDVDIEKCDEKQLYDEYIKIYQKFSPFNALVIYDMRADLNQRKYQLIEQFHSYIKIKYGSDISIIDCL